MAPTNEADKKRLDQLSAAAEAARYTGSAASGLVRVVINGLQEVQEVIIEPKALGAEGAAQLPERLREAINKAIAASNRGMRRDASALSAALGLPSDLLAALDPPVSG